MDSLLGRWKFQGKKWYDFRELENNKMEILFQKFLYSQGKEYLFDIEIDKFMYTVDFANMKQKNISTGRTRDIYRETSSNIKQITPNEFKPKNISIINEDPDENKKSSVVEKTKEVKKNENANEESQFQQVKSPASSSKVKADKDKNEIKESLEEKPREKTKKVETNEDANMGSIFKAIQPAISKIMPEEEIKRSDLQENSKEKPKEKTKKVEPTDMESTSFVLFNESKEKQGEKTTIAVDLKKSDEDDEEDDFNQNIIWEIKFISKELWLPFDRNACKALENSYQRQQNGEALLKPITVNFRGINFHINVVKMNHDYNDLGYKKQNIRRRELKPLDTKVDVIKQMVKMKVIFGDLNPPFNKYYCQQITNKILLERYENTKKKQTKSAEKLLFHGTKRVYLSRILKEGFVLPNSNDGMLGDKIYMCEDMEKAIQYCDSKDVIIIAARCLMNQKEPVEYQNEKYKEYGFSKEELLYPQYVLYSRLDDE